MSIAVNQKFFEESVKSTTDISSSKEFVKEVSSFMEPMMEISRKIARKYFVDEKPTNEDYVRHFKLKMFNERINMVEIAKEVSKMDITEDPTKCILLSKQVMDEANHFRLVKEVVEYYNGGPIDIAAEEKIHGQREAGKGAALIDKYNVLGDPLLLAAYQYIVEGRAAVVWQTMSECVPDEFVAKRYGQIARDEKFHQNIGRLELEKLCDTPEAQERVRGFLKELIWDLWEISCLSNTMPSEDIKQDMVTAYGQPHRELLVAV
jgi:hypothetical protein